MHSATTTITVPESVAGRLMHWLGSPAAAELQREAADKVLQQRKADAAERLTIEATRHDLHKKFTPKEAAALKRLEDARAAVTAATDAVLQLRQAHHAADWPLERRFDELTQALRASAPQAIRDFMAEMTQHVDMAQSQGRTEDIRTAAGLVPTSSTWASVHRRVKAIQRSRDTVDALALQVLTDADLAKALQAIRDSWPPVELERL